MEGDKTLDCGHSILLLSLHDIDEPVAIILRQASFLANADDFVCSCSRASLSLSLSLCAVIYGTDIV